MSGQRPELTHGEIEELLGAYALDAVDQPTAELVDRHLQECVRCAAEVAQHRQVAALLANSGGAPPAELWDGIARRLAGTTPPSWDLLARRLASETGDEEVRGDDRTGELVDDGAEGSAGQDEDGSRMAAVVPITSARPFRTRALGIVAAAAVLIAVVLGAQNVHLHHQVNALQSPSPLTRAEQAVLRAPSTKQVQLAAVHASTGSRTDGRVTVVLTDSGTGFVEAEGVSSLPKSETYQLWGVIGGQTISLGLLGSSPAVVPFSVAGSAPVHALAITVEQAGGVVQSRNQPVFAGEVTS